MSTVLSRALLFVLLGTAAPTSAGEALGGIVLQAMRDELARSVEKLHMARMERPYFLAYRIDQSQGVTATARFGALTRSRQGKQRTLAVEVRVGDPNLDNGNFLPTRPGDSILHTIPLPLDDDYQELRRQLWLATDAAYKHALEVLAKKRAALQNRTREEMPDFTAEEPATVFAKGVAAAPDADAVAALARDISRVFKDMPDIQDSRVTAAADVRQTYYVNSEGSAFVQAQPSAAVLALAKTQASDGTVLQDFETFYTRRWEHLPSGAELARQVRSMGAALAARREAEFVDRYNGPVLFEGQAAAELFAQVLAPRLLAARVPIGETSRMDSYIATLRNPFEDKIGARVLPRFLDVRDDPTATEYQGSRLLGGYLVDDDGVLAAPTAVVENGILKTLLATRNPVAGMTASTGNRRDGRVLPSNLLVTTERGLSAEEMRAEFAALVRERGNDFGIVVRRLGSPTAKLHNTGFSSGGSGQISVERLVRAYRVYPDGREELIRKAELSGVSEATFKEIVAASDSSTVHTSPWASGAFWFLYASAQYGSSMGDGRVSYVVPDLLFEEVTVRKPAGNVPRLPVAGHPFFE